LETSGRLQPTGTKCAPKSLPGSPTAFDGEETSQSDVGPPDLPSVTLTYDYGADGNRTAMDDSLGGLVSYTMP
jgi:YD repeat-containing protein